MEHGGREGHTGIVDGKTTSEHFGGMAIGATPQAPHLFPLILDILSQSVYPLQVASFRATFQAIPAFAFDLKIEEAYNNLDKWDGKLEDIEKDAKELRELQDLFDLTPSEFKELKVQHSPVCHSASSHVWNFGRCCLSAFWNFWCIPHTWCFACVTGLPI